MSDKFQFIQDAINHSLAFENETNRETVERDTEDYIQNEIDTPTSWHWKKEDIANKMKTLQQEQYTALYSFKEDGYNEWLAEYQLLIDVDKSELSKKAQVHFFEIEDILQRIDDRIDKVFDDDEKVYKSDKTELREDLERLTIQTDLLYKTNNNEDWKDAFREALDKVSLFETFVPLDEVFDTKKRMAILADLSDRLDAGDLHTFVKEIEYHQDVIDFSEIHEILDEMRSNLLVSDVFQTHSDREILDLVRHNDNFWQWFESDENNEDSLSYRLSMVEDGLPRLFYRGLRDVADEEEIEVGNYEEASYNADYFSSNPKVAGTYISLDQDEYDNTSKIFSGFLRPAENPFVLPCDVHFVHDGWGKPSTANWNNLLEHYNIYEAMCLFEMAGLDNEILKANWDDAFDGMRVTDVETYAYTDAERNDDDEWNKPVKTFVFYKREHSGSLKAYEFIVNEHYTPDDFRGKDGRIPSFVQETELLVSTNDMKANIQAQGKHDRVYFLNCVDVGGGGISDSLNRSESRSIIVAAWHFDPTSYGKSYFKEVRNNGDFDIRDNRIFYSLFDIEQDIRYDLNTQENSEFARAVERIIQTREAVGRFISLGKTPDSWQLIGIPDVKVSIQDDRIQKVMGEYLNLQNHSHSHIHNLTPEQVKQLPEQLNDPIAILKSAPTSSNPDGYLVLTELLETDKKTGEEKPVVAALNLVRNRKDNEIRIVNVTTAFGRDNWQTERDINNGLLRYWDKDKGQKFLNTTSLQLLADVTSSSALASRNIKTNEDLMQYRKEKEMSKQSETAFSETPTVIASEQSERGNLHTTENGRLNQEIATPATQVRNDGLNSGSLNDNPNTEQTAQQGGFSLDSERQAWNEFFDDRDNRAFTARWNMQRMLPEQLGDAAYQHLSVETLRQAYIEHPDVFDKINEDAKVSGFYISDENKVVLIADAFIGREQTAVFTAWHELAHRGIAVQGRELWDDWLQTARKNDTVKEIADRIQIVYEHQGIQLNDLQATEEAVAEIFAAYKTQEWETLEQRHQIELSHEFKKPLGTAARLWHSAKNRIGKIFGISQENRQTDHYAWGGQNKITDEQLFAMLGKLEQSIYQQPEFAVHERLAMGEAFTNYYDLNNQWKQLDLFETLTTTDFANGIDDNHLSGSLTTTRGADTVIASENPTVIASEPSERGNLTTTESETPTIGNLNNQEIATTATQSRNDGIRPTISKEEKEHLNEVKKSLQAAKKELKALRKEFEDKQGYSYFNKIDAELAIIRKQREILETQSQYENLLVEQKTKTGELSDLEKEIYAARAMAYVPYDKIDQAKDLIEQSLRARADIVEKFFKTEWQKVDDEIKALQQRLDSKDLYEFEIQAAMQDALAYFTPTKVNGLTLYHKGEVLPLATDRDKAVAWLLKEVMIDQKNQLIDKQNGLRRKINSIYPLVIQNDYKEKLSERAFKSRNRLEILENQIVDNMIDLRVERNLTYDINTPDGEKKVRDLFYGSQHDEQQAELFERVFAMAQKLNVEVRHALRNENSFDNEDTRAVLGRYYFDSNSARVKHNGYIKTEEKGEVLLHELIHSVTSRAMFLKEQGRTDLLNAPQIQAIEDIEKIYKLVVEKAEELGLEKYSHQKGDYGLKNSHEMLAELANPEFRDKLKQIGVFDDTVAKITEISTGVGQAETVYDRLTKALYQLMDNYDPDFGEKYDKAKIRNIQMFDIKEENHMQEELLNQLDSQDASIRRDAASSEYADEAVLRKAFDDKHWQVREDAMRNTRATPELLHEWYQNADPYDKAIILDNPRIGNKTLIDALSDDNDLRYQALYRADKDANREVLHIAEQNSNPEIAKLASQYVSFYEPKIGNQKDPTWLDANLIREDWEHTLNSFNSMQALNETLTVESNLNQEDLVQLANLHQTKPELREKIENLLNESQLHQAINDLKQGQYDQFRLPETLSVIASEQSERGNLLNTENDPLVLDNGKFTQYAFETKVQDILRKDFAEIIELSKQPENPEWVQKQEEVFNLLQSIHHFEGQDLRAMAAVKETNNPVITQLIERAISEPYPYNDWNRQEILSGRLNNPENQNPTVIASEQSERGNLPTTENEQNLSGSLKEPTANNGGLILPENIQNTEFGKQAASVWQSTADNPRKIENTADNRSKDILSKHNTYIEALKTDLKDLIETGDFYKASERLGDIRLNQQVFDERIQKAEIQNSLPEQNPTADKGGISSPVYGQQNQMVVANAAQKQHKSKRR